jgi:hypothetical protein
MAKVHRVIISRKAGEIIIIMTNKKRIMIDGAMQSGKTEYVVKRALDNQNTNTVEVFIHYSTNESMESTNEKIKRYNVELFSGLEALKRFHLRLTRKGLDSDKKYVLSLIAHYSSMEQLKKIITAHHTTYGIGYTFNINIDEDDTLALDHSIKKGKPVQKQRLAQAIIEMPGVGEVRNVSATPFAEHLSETDFDEKVTAPVGENYVGVKTIIDHANDNFTEEDISSFSSLEPTKGVKDFINDSFEGVTLIQVSKNKKDHIIIAKNIIAKNNIVVVMNSDKGNYGCYVDGKGYGNKTDHWNPFKAYKLAEELGIKKVFIVAYYLSDRTNTFRAREGLFNNLRSIFYCSPSATHETKLQRLARICGYPIGHIPQLYTTPETLDYLSESVDLYTRVMNIKEDIRSAKDRQRIWASIGNIDMKKIKHTNGYANTKAQSYTITSNPKNIITQEFNGEVPENIDISNTNLLTNTNLAQYIKDYCQVNTVLNVTEDTRKRMLLIRPNQPSQTGMQAHRELAVLFKGREFKAIKQEHEYYTTKEPFALHNMDGTYWQWNVNDGVSR